MIHSSNLSSLHALSCYKLGLQLVWQIWSVCGNLGASAINQLTGLPILHQQEMGSPLINYGIPQINFFRGIFEQCICSGCLLSNFWQSSIPISLCDTWFFMKFPPNICTSSHYATMLNEAENADNTPQGRLVYGQAPREDKHCLPADNGWKWRPLKRCPSWRILLWLHQMLCHKFGMEMMWQYKCVQHMCQYFGLESWQFHAIL